MKRFAILLLLSFVSAFAIADNAANSCEEKRADILKQIDHARQNGNDRRVAGLNKALREQEANCSSASLRKAREKDVAEARAKLAERERELQEAKAEGKDAGKLARREAKVTETQDELQRAQKALGE
ncbi:MAG TPA: DUF1090 domain-containing protein [Oxalicibacterium sp.]